MRASSMRKAMRVSELAGVPIESEEQRQAVFDALSDLQLEYCFVMAAARDEHDAAERLQRELEKREASAAGGGDCGGDGAE